MRWKNGENDELWDLYGILGLPYQTKPVVFVAPYIMESEKDGLTMPHYRNPIPIPCAMTAMVVLL